MTSASDQKNLTDEDMLAPLVDGETSAEHEARLRAEIEKTLARKKSGELAYHSLDDVMRKFGF